MAQTAGGHPEATAQIGVTGLAVMGRNLARHGHRVAVHNRSPERTRSLVAEHGHEGTFVPSESMAEFVASVRRPRVVIVMVKAGGPTDAVLDELVPLLDPGDIVVDCGNAHFADTRRREAALGARGLHFVGTGVSGGEEGAQTGVPAPAFASSLAYVDGLRRDRLPAALIQGLRDNVGAHTYRRVDAEGSFHTRWAGDRTETPA